MKQYSLCLPILPMHHPNKNPATLARSSPVLNTLQDCEKQWKQHKDKKLSPKHHHTKQRKDQKQRYPFHPRHTEHVSVKEKKQHC